MKYINRDMSWIDFNKRVLFQTMRDDVPLMEKINFLSITGSNMDEFIMVRFSKLLHRLERNISTDLNGLSLHQEYKEILKGISDFKDAQQRVHKLLEKALRKNKVEIVKYNDLSKDEKNKVTNIFYNRIFPALSPISYDTNKDFPELLSKEENLIASIEGRDGNETIAFIAFPKGIDKMYELKTRSNTGWKKFIPLYEILYGMAHKIFIGKKIKMMGRMKLYRDGFMDINTDKSVYLVDRMEESILKREYSQPIFIDFSSDTPEKLGKLVRKIFEIPKNHVWADSTLIDYSALTEMKLDSKYYYEEYIPQYPVDLIGEQDMFTAIDNNDIMIHHPYESFDPIMKLLDHASRDKDVLSIKQTLYRVSSADSEIVESLCRAAKNGKSVTIAIELKARFDEITNISLIDKLRNSGCKLVFGHDILKTHCKFISIVKRHKTGLRLYTHIGTGNYNENTSKIYTDISYFTSNQKIGRDVLNLFNTINGIAEPGGDIDKVHYSPHDIRSQFYKSVDKEIEMAKKGKEATIVIKCNSISDKGIIDKLYEAAKYGVKIYIFVRGICSIKPVKNIEIKSIIGRFLEHSRIYYFQHGKMYISSADLLTRNLDRRFELMVPITDKSCKDKLINIMGLYFGDTKNSFIMKKNGTFHYVGGKTDVHKLFMKTAMDSSKMKNIPGLSGKKKKRK